MLQTSCDLPAVERPSASQSVVRSLRNPVKALFLGLIRFYQVVISPGLPGRCKYYPSCSQYALDAVREYGAARGLVLAVWRVLRCNPLSYGGYDPVSRQRLFRARVREGAGLGVASPADSNAAVCAHRHAARG
jgi:uncharacterized protein